VVAKALVVLLLLGSLAHAGKKRKVAVLEFRAGTQSASNLAPRMAAILRSATSLDVVDPDDARRALGAQVDAEVARCRGDAGCVASLARKLEVAEVVLVGVSELGDVIVVLQRITRDGKVQSRIAESLPKGAEPDDVALEGYLKRILPPSDFRRYGTIHIRANVPGAEVVIAGKRRGQTPLDPVLIEAPAKIDLRVSKEGFVDYTMQIDVPPEAVVEVRPVLTRREGAWYGKWWVWAIAGGVATTAIVSTAILLQNEPDTVGGSLELPPMPSPSTR
jgi:hypothetical protein